MNKKLLTIFTYLKELFPAPETELHYSTPFQFVVAVMLSAQATDLQVNKVTEKLFKKIKTPEDLLTMGFPSFLSAIKSVNYYQTKAKHIFATAKIIQNAEFRMQNKKYKDWIPDTLEELVKLPWVGVKTGKLIAHVLYDTPYIAVDTHIHRVSNRLWLVNTTSPEKTSEQLEKLIPDEYKDHAHHALVLFWRYYCKAVKPRCESCKLQKICDYYKNNVIASVAKQS